MRRLVVVVLAVALALTLTGCGGGEEPVEPTPSEEAAPAAPAADPNAEGFYLHMGAESYIHLVFSLSAISSNRTWFICRGKRIS